MKFSQFLTEVKGFQVKASILQILDDSQEKDDLYLVLKFSKVERYIRAYREYLSYMKVGH